jgi:methyl-accepting chemotaxis protein
MEEVVGSSNRVKELLAEMTNGAREQSIGISQVGEAVHQLDETTQQNAALVEQTAAASAAMKDQAQTLAHEVERFQLPAGLALEEHAGPAGDFDFDAAIGAHRAWKVKLRQAIGSREQLDADTICQDNRCPLGQWLHGPGGAQWGHSPGFVNLLDKHAQFHRVAGGVARKINAGAYAEAERLIGAGSEFALVSTEVATLLTRAKRGL